LTNTESAVFEDLLQCPALETGFDKELQRLAEIIQRFLL
jgi:hypothetical protein